MEVIYHVIFNIRENKNRTLEKVLYIYILFGKLNLTYLHTWAMILRAFLVVRANIVWGKKVNMQFNLNDYKHLQLAPVTCCISLKFSNKYIHTPSRELIAWAIEKTITKPTVSISRNGKEDKS